MTHDTSPDDAAERARQAPDEASTADIESALRGRRLFDVQLAQKIDGCRRCQEKNHKRRYAGVDPVDGTFDDGDAVTIYAVHRQSDYAGPHWLMTAVEHSHHAQIPFGDVASQGTDIVRARARVTVTGQGEHIVDVHVTHRSGRGDGPVSSVVERRRQSHIADDDEHHPDDVTVIATPTDEAPAHWPELDRMWLDRLADEHGPLEFPTYGSTSEDAEIKLEEPGTEPVNPSGDGR